MQRQRRRTFLARRPLERVTRVKHRARSCPVSRARRPGLLVWRRRANDRAATPRHRCKSQRQPLDGCVRHLPRRFGNPFDSFDISGPVGCLRVRPGHAPMGRRQFRGQYQGRRTQHTLSEAHRRLSATAAASAPWYGEGDCHLAGSRRRSSTFGDNVLVMTQQRGHGSSRGGRERAGVSVIHARWRAGDRQERDSIEGP